VIASVKSGIPMHDPEKTSNRKVIGAFNAVSGRNDG
jgi:hypothetical protein